MTKHRWVDQGHNQWRCLRCGYEVANSSAKPWNKDGHVVIKRLCQELWTPQLKDLYAELPVDVDELHPDCDVQLVRSVNVT